MLEKDFIIRLMMHCSRNVGWCIVVQDNSNLQEADHQEWERTFQKLLHILRLGVILCVEKGLLTQEDKELFFISGFYFIYVYIYIYIYIICIVTELQRICYFATDRSKGILCL